VNITFPFVDTDGHAVQVLLSEELKKDGTPLVPMRTGNDFADTWTLKASTAPQTVAQHEYMEFRYAMIVNTPGKLRLADVNGWVIRYPLSDALDDMYGDVPALKPTVLRRPAALATFSSNLAPLNAVWGLVRHTLVAVSLDVMCSRFGRIGCSRDAEVQRSVSISAVRSHACLLNVKPASHAIQTCGRGDVISAMAKFMFDVGGVEASITCDPNMW
jgi:hypothetical protein